MAIQLTDSLREEYRRLFDTCEIQPERQETVARLVTMIVQNKDRYRSVGTSLGIPWFFIGAIHNMESSLSFKGHLHNGDPLTARTVHVPKGRPAAGAPPFTWEESATDALQLEKLDDVTDWTMPGILFQLEGYNGFGYRTNHPDVLSPYLWSFSNHYTAGKFVEDGKFDPDAKSQQCGAAVILRRMAENGTIQFTAGGDPVLDLAVGTTDSLSGFAPLVVFSETEKSDVAAALQRALNAIPGIFLRVDGIPGRRTSDAFRKITGHFLKGDPKSQAAAARP
jgi:lysozyme family protein